MFWTSPSRSGPSTSEQQRNVKERVMAPTESNENVPLVPAAVYGTTNPTPVDDVAHPPAASVLVEAQTVLIDESPMTTLLQQQPRRIEEWEITPDIGPACRDLPFAILFAVHLVAVLIMGIGFAPKGWAEIQWNWTVIENALPVNDDDFTIDDLHRLESFVQTATEYSQIYPQRIFLFLVLPCCFISALLTYMVTTFLVRPFSTAVIYVCLLLLGALTLTVLLSFTVSTITSDTVADNIVWYIVVGGVALAVTWFICKVWRKVPFAAVNLEISLTAMSTNAGMYFVAFGWAAICVHWFLYWGYTLVGFAAYRVKGCQRQHPFANFDIFDDDVEYDDVCDPPLPFVLFMFTSLFWTSTVVMNIMQVTVAGVMATWCLDLREASNCCSFAIWTSTYRSLTYSFGSICLGSLLQAIVSLIRRIVHRARARMRQHEINDCACCCGELSLLGCITEFLSRCLEEIVEWFNQWAFVFIGIYGLSYLDSGKRAFELFRDRGWSIIVTDGLVDYALHVTTAIISLLTGAVGVVVEYWVEGNFNSDDTEQNAETFGQSFLFGPLPGGGWRAFTIGCLTGIWVPVVMMNVIKGAVNTLIVCWADSPSVFATQHASLTQKLAGSWAIAYPKIISQAHAQSVAVPTATGATQVV